MLSPGRASATPRLHVTDRLQQSALNGSSARRMRRPSANAPAASRSAPSSRMANSSPPSRPTMPCWFAASQPMPRSTWSPTSCPQLSLMSLKWSTSNMMAANGIWRTRSARSKKARRLKTPVSGSTQAKRISSPCRRSIRSAERNRAYSSSQTGGFLMNSSAPLSRALIRCCSSELDDIRMI